MTTSLSILLPVHNAEDCLEQQVCEILDVLPELTSRFDVLIVDDGSTDETPEVAASLVRRYPQVRATRHPIRLGLNQALQTGLEQATGEVVFVGDEKYGLDPQDLRKLWHLRNERSDQGGATEPRKTSWLKKLIDWESGSRHPTRSHLTVGLQMIHRDRPAVPARDDAKGSPGNAAPGPSHGAEPLRRPKFNAKNNRWITYD